MNKKLEITIEVEYDLGDESLSRLKMRATDAVRYMMGEGWLTDDTSASVEEWDVTVTEVAVDEPTYRIVRFYQKGHPREVIAEGLTLAEAQEHCGDPEASSSSATEPVNVVRTREMGPWFDGYEEE